MDIRNLSGPLKAAILIRSLGSELTGNILNGLSEAEKKVVNQHLDQMGTISAPVIEFVAREFMTDAAMKTRSALPAPSARPLQDRQMVAVAVQRRRLLLDRLSYPPHPMLDQ